MSIVHNVMKVADIDSSQISQELAVFLAGRQIYSDQILKEHLYSTEGLLEDADHDAGDGNTWPETIVEELTRINTELEENDCAYFRITFN